MEYDDKFGSIVCASPPINLMVLPFQWLTLFPLSDDFLYKYNKFLCFLLYLPIAILITSIFLIGTTLYTPFAWLSHLIVLIQTITEENENMDDLSEKLKRVRTIFYFLLFGLPILCLAIPCDGFVFFYNLFTSPNSDEEELIAENHISDQSLEIF